MNQDTNASNGINGHANHAAPTPRLDRATEVNDVIQPSTFLGSTWTNMIHSS
jgi:hypothetical protein